MKRPTRSRPDPATLRAPGSHGVGCEKATEGLASLSAGQVGWCPESASRPAVWARTHARGASLRQLQVHDDAQNGHSRVGTPLPAR